MCGAVNGIMIQIKTKGERTTAHEGIPDSLILPTPHGNQ